jgi:hypothetical protein
MLAVVVEQRQVDVFPNRVRPVEPNRVGRLNLNDAKATKTLDAEQVPRILAEPALLNG